MMLTPHQRGDEGQRAGDDDDGEAFESASKFFAKEDEHEMERRIHDDDNHKEDPLDKEKIVVQNDSESIPDADEELAFLRAASGTNVAEEDFEAWAVDTANDPEVAAKFQAKAIEKMEACYGEGSPGEYLVSRSAPLSAEGMIRAYGRFASPEADNTAATSSPGPISDDGGVPTPTTESKDGDDRATEESRGDEEEEAETQGGGFDLADFCITDELLVEDEMEAPPSAASSKQDADVPDSENEKPSPVHHLPSPSVQIETQTQTKTFSALRAVKAANRKLSLICHSPHPGVPTIDSPVINLQYETPRGSTLHPESLALLKKKFGKRDRTLADVRQPQPQANSPFSGAANENVNSTNVASALTSRAKASPPGTQDIILGCKLGGMCTFEVPIRNAGGNMLKVHLSLLDAGEDSPFSLNCVKMTLRPDIRSEFVMLTFRPSRAGSFQATLRMQVEKLGASGSTSIVTIPVKASAYGAPSVLTDRPVVDVGGVSLGFASTGRLSLRNTCSEPLDVAFSIIPAALPEVSGESDPANAFVQPLEAKSAFSAHEKRRGGGKRGGAAVRRARIDANAETDLVVVFEPKRIAQYRASLSIECTHALCKKPVIYSVPLLGYGGKSSLTFRAEHVKGLTQLAIVNKGDRAAYFRVMDPDMSETLGAIATPKPILPGDRHARIISVPPNACCTDGSFPHLVVRWGDEVLRSKRAALRVERQKSNIHFDRQIIPDSVDCFDEGPVVKNPSKSSDAFRFDHYFVEELFSVSMVMDRVPVVSMPPPVRRDGLTFEAPQLGFGTWHTKAKKAAVQYVKLENRIGIDVSVTLKFLMSSAKVKVKARKKKSAEFYVRKDHYKLKLRTGCFVRIPVRFAPRRRGEIVSSLEASVREDGVDSCAVVLRGVGV